MAQQQPWRPLALQDLPCEMIISTADFLPPVSRAAFGLVCRDFHFALGSSSFKALRVDAELKAQFLRLIEADLPEWLHCACCNKLFRWKRNVKLGRYQCPACWLHMLDDCNRRDYHTASLNSACFHSNTFSGLGTEIDLVLLQHSKGSKYGLPISFLNHKCACQFDTKGWPLGSLRRDPMPQDGDYHVRKSFTGRIIDGQILMHSTFKIAFDKHCNPLKAVEKLGHHSCHCADDHINAAALCAWMHPEEMENAPLVGSSGRLCQQLLKCYECDTDYRIKVKKCSNPNEIQFTVHMYQNLGGRTPLTPRSRQVRHWDNNRRFPTNNEARQRLEAVLARDLEQTFWTESWVLIPPEVPTTTDCIIQKWYCSASERSYHRIELPDYGKLVKSFTTIGTLRSMRSASAATRIAATRNSMAEAMAALHTVSPVATPRATILDAVVSAGAALASAGPTSGDAPSTDMPSITTDSTMAAPTTTTSVLGAGLGS